jgi:hypothetical protein
MKLVEPAVEDPVGGSKESWIQTTSPCRWSTVDALCVKALQKSNNPSHVDVWRSWKEGSG